jgi:multiple sugar transport system ATP-binding protein
MVEIKLENITKEYISGVESVSDVSFNIHGGEFIVLVGPSGCGKTSILRMIAGLEEITSGQLYFGGELVNNKPPNQRSVGMVFQNYALYPHLTVWENIAFPLKIKGEKKQAISEQVNRIVEIIGLSDDINKKPKQLSGGQRQRVALGRALVRKPDIFLFDEPLSNLDAKLRVQMRTEIIQLHKEFGTTSVYVTHDQTEAMTMGDRIVVMNEGKIHQIATPGEIYSNPADVFTAQFIGSPQMNFFDIIANESGIYSVLDTDYRIDLRNQNRIDNNIKCGVRPEDIALSTPNEMSFKVVVIYTEYLGFEQLIYFRHQNELKCLRTSLDACFSSGDTISIKFDESKIRLFDERGLRIR